MSTNIVMDFQSKDGKSLHLIGISGKIGSGKTTLSKYIAEEYPQYEVRSFAENVRKNVSLITGISIEHMRTHEQKNYRVTALNKTVGELLQHIATKLKEIHPDIWVASLFSEYTPSILKDPLDKGVSGDEVDRYTDSSSNSSGSPRLWIIDDVRFPNEANMIKQCGGFLIRLEGDPGNVRKISSRDLNHTSETSLDTYEGFDLIINTDSNTPEDILSKLSNKI